MQDNFRSVQQLITQADIYLGRKQYSRAESAILSAFAGLDEMLSTRKKASDVLKAQLANGEPSPCRFGFTAPASAAAPSGSPCEVAPTTPAVTTHPHLQRKGSFEQEAESIRSFLEANLFGQPAAVDAGVRAYLQSIAPIKRPDQPLSVVLSLGKSRTGKSELPRLLAEYLHGSKRSLVRIDLSQYIESHQIATLIGSPPGYVGYSELAKFSRETLEKSRGGSKNNQIILVLEELEKAHPAVADVLLGLLDNGEAELASGETVDFRDVILFMTSNLASKELGQLGKLPLGFSPLTHTTPTDKQILAEVNGALSKAFRPEFLNRIDAVVIYRDLDVASLRSILRREVDRLQQQLNESSHTTFVLEESAEEFLVKKAIAISDIAGLENGSGSSVAELKRLVVKSLMNELNRILMSGRIPFDARVVARYLPGSTDITVAVENPPNPVVTTAVPDYRSPVSAEEWQTTCLHRDLFLVANKCASMLEERGREQRGLNIRRMASQLDFDLVPDAEVIPNLLAVAQLYARERSYLKAERLYLKAEEKADLAGDKGVQLTVLDEVACYFETRHKAKAAITRLTKMSELQATERSTTDVTRANTHIRIATCLHTSRKFVKALGEYQKALSFLKVSDERDAAMHAIVLCKISETYRASDQLELSSEVIRQAAVIVESLGNAEARAFLLDEQGAFAYATGRYHEARALYEESIALRQQLGNDHCVEVAATLARLGMCCFALRQNATSAEFLEQSAWIYRVNRFSRTAEGAAVLAKLSGIYKMQGRLLESMVLSSGVEEIEVESDNGSMPAYIELFSKALNYEEREEFDQAEIWYRKLLDLLRTSQPEVSAEAIGVYCRLFALNGKRKCNREEKTCFARAEHLLRELSGNSRSSDLVIAACRLAHAYSLQAQDAWAESFYVFARALSQRDCTFAEEAVVCENYSVLLDHSDRHSEALELRACAARLRRKRKQTRTKKVVGAQRVASTP